MKKLQNKTVFITGSSRGIGRDIALICAEQGANVIIAAKSDKPHPKLPGTIHSVAQEVEQLGGKALAAAKVAGWIAPEALIVWEESRAQIAPPGFISLDQRRYGDTWVSFLRHDG